MQPNTPIHGHALSVCYDPLLSWRQDKESVKETYNSEAKYDNHKLIKNALIYIMANLELVTTASGSS